MPPRQTRASLPCQPPRREAPTPYPAASGCPAGHRGTGIRRDYRISPPGRYGEADATGACAAAAGRSQESLTAGGRRPRDHSSSSRLRASPRATCSCASASRRSSTRSCGSSNAACQRRSCAGPAAMSARCATQDVRRNRRRETDRGRGPRGSRFCDATEISRGHFVIRL